MVAPSFLRYASGHIVHFRKDSSLFWCRSTESGPLLELNIDMSVNIYVPPYRSMKSILWRSQRLIQVYVSSRKHRYLEKERFFLLICSTGTVSICVLCCRQRFDASSTALQVLHGQDLSGQLAVVTGASSGIGYHTARVRGRAVLWLISGSGPTNSSTIEWIVSALALKVPLTLIK